MLASLICFLTHLTTMAQTDDIQVQDTLQEVIITSQSAEQRVKEIQIGAEKVDVKIMSRLPALFGERDIIKGLQLLPGVKIEGDGLGGYQVRGGTSTQNNILLDGATVYNIGHLMGLFSSFNDDAIGGAELFKGLMPARYGGGSSSVLNMSTRTGDTRKSHLSASVGILSAKAEADGPLGKKVQAIFLQGAPHTSTYSSKHHANTAATPSPSTTSTQNSVSGWVTTTSSTSPFSAATT